MRTCWVLAIVAGFAACSDSGKPALDASAETSTLDMLADATSEQGTTDALTDTKATPDVGDPCKGCGALGCCTNHCCKVEPSNSSDLGTLTKTGLILGPPNGVFDTTTDCTSSSVLGQCKVVALSGSPDVCVCRMDELTIGTLKVTGTPALAILAHKSVKITGSLSVAGKGGAAGPGASFKYSAAATSLSGGSGGSYAGAGGNSGAAVYGTDTIVPLNGGMNGQGSCNSRPGGGGGGALQITAGETIMVSGTINAGGGGGSAGSTTGTCLGGAGGGSGGAVLLEAPSVTMQGTVAANGGGGGGGSSDDYGMGTAGTDGQASSNAASGGSGEDGHGCSLKGYTSGGDGGKGSSSSSLVGSNGQSSDSVSGCLGGTTYVGAGGGGGGAGRIRVNTKTGCVCAGTFAPQPTQGQLQVK